MSETRANSEKIKPSTLRHSLNPFSGRNNRKEGNNEILSSVDELAEFYDPYSDLNLFLVQKITQEMRHCGISKKWSLKIQEELLKKISPEFQEKFPRYRLGLAALKKTWEKIAYYSQQLQQQKEAVTQDGKLNVNFFIKEHLKTFAARNNLNQFHPCHFAHQLGVKISECIATIDGVRPKLDHITKLIWSIQRHLLSGGGPEQFKSPYDEYDKIDKLIVRTILEITARDPQMGHTELEYKVKETLHSLHELPSFSSVDTMTDNVAALLAEKLYASSRFHSLYSSEQKHAIIDFIKRYRPTDKTSLSQLVHTILDEYTKDSTLPELKHAELEIMESVIWKVLSETEGLLEKLPYRIGQRIEEEIANQLIDHPEHTFSSLVHDTVQFFKRTQELVDVKKWNEIERKVHTWAVQGDMLCRWIHLDIDSPLLNLICREWQATTPTLTHHLFINHICQEYLKEHPELTMYMGQLALRVSTLYKYAWYALLSTKEESSYDRFLKWHALSLMKTTAQPSREYCIGKLEELVKKTLPLIPFDHKYCGELLDNLASA